MTSIVFLITYNLIVSLILLGLFARFEYKRREGYREMKKEVDDLAAKWQEKGAEYSKEEVK